MRFKLLIIPLLALLLGGCSISNLGSSLKANMYFREADYERGISVFQEKVKSSPESSLDNYYLGRFYLAGGMVWQALPYLKHAVSLEPTDADYQFWLGVASGASGNFYEERKRYQKVLELSPYHGPARLYLAHLQLQEGHYRQALQSYDKLLERYPYNASALYNRALSLKLTGQRPKEKNGWLEYLKYYPSGFLARKAADRLNQLGDFSYRNHPFGSRTVTLKEIKFQPGSDVIQFDSRQSMRLAGAIVSNFSSGDLQITVFANGNSNLAKKRAQSLRAFLMEEYPELDSDRIKLSWFGRAESLYGSDRRYVNSESVRLYLTDWR